MANNTENDKKEVSEVVNNRLSVESKESSYMGFDRGIDSDIEIEPRNEEHPTARCSSEPHLKKRLPLTPKLARWESMDPPESGESQTLVEAEVKIEENGTAFNSNQMKNPEQENLMKKQGVSPLVTEIQKVIINHRIPDPGNCYPPVAQHNSGDSSIGPVGFTKYILVQHGSRKYTSDSFLLMLSGIYAKLLIVMGICFPVAEVISKRIPVTYYEGFYLYLYGGSIAFLIFMYCFTLHSERCCKIKSLFCFSSITISSNSISQSVEETNSNPNSLKSLNQTSKMNKLSENKESKHFYLRLGAVAFGIASMIYSGLEFGQFLELQPGSSCYNVLYGISPLTRMAFTFIQMYFIFLNSEVCIRKYKSLARFGLMHMVATNLCIWLHVLVQETKHGILNVINVNFTLPLTFSVPLNMIAEVANEENFTDYVFEEVSNSTRGNRSVREDIASVILECRRSNIMGELVQEASHFLFPCTIQYSLICSAILYIMWKNIGKQQKSTKSNMTASHHSSYSALQRQYNQVYCTKSNKGLFSGILVLVLSIISIILFFVFINKSDYKMFAIMEAKVTELGLYLLTSVAVCIALLQTRELKYSAQLDTELDRILLIVSQSGLYLFTMFSIIGSYFTTDQNTLLVLVTSLACITQATLQTIFILDAFHCSATTTDQVRRMPGRELVTFLLVCNIATWSMNTLQAQRSDSNPIQLQFYGFWVWTIITHITTPLAIYFRFHSTVCLCTIWKRTYKIKFDYV
ncbi:proton channel OtopLc [Parasteatoda tepidariorum]|uniref:proton channel OtopLc n=1 Tax=Parasteatoda tepidariorum TaxID=114398 RepID=UPI00077F8C6A|nr:proton channel OtopLc [Parasteatoda tepidariorum]